MDGFWPHHISYGVLPLGRTLLRLLFVRYVAVFKAIAQNLPDNLAACFMARVPSINVLLILSIEGRQLQRLMYNSTTFKKSYEL